MFQLVILHNGVIRADGAPRDIFSKVEQIHELGLAAPETVELCYELNQQGFSLPLDLLDTETCAQAIFRALNA